MTLPKLAIKVALTAAMLAGGALLVDRRAALREAQAEAAYPPTGQLITVNGSTVHADVQGAGPDLILLHGASGNSRDFTFALVDLLKDDYRVIAFDRPGLGWSDSLGARGRSPISQAQLLQAAAETLGVTRPIVLGHSYGGAVAMAWGLSAVEKPGALVIVGGATMPWPSGTLGPFYQITGSTLGGATLIPVISAFVPISRADQAISGIFAPDPVPPGYAAFIGAGLTLRRDTLRANFQQMNTLWSHLNVMRPDYPQLTMPIELIHGTDDATVPVAVHARPLAALLPNANLVEIPGASHMPHHSHPGAIVAAIHRAALRAGLRDGV